MVKTIGCIPLLIIVKLYFLNIKSQRMYKYNKDKQLIIVILVLIR